MDSSLFIPTLSYTEKSCHLELDKNVQFLRFQFYEETTQQLF